MNSITIETMTVEQLREQYKPERVRILLVGESAPADGTFFYDCSAMTTFTKGAFENGLGMNFDAELNDEFSPS